MAQTLASKSCRVELHGIYFDSGSAVLLEESEPMLKQVAQLVKSSPEATLTIEGHTDNIGSADYNQKLSEQRAAAVRDALVARYAIPANRLTAKGFGLTRPVDSNATIVGRAHNRRVELARPCAEH
jgi:outer membrane protein OmpA-like peptidoglycan-associated protein